MEKHTQRMGAGGLNKRWRGVLGPGEMLIDIQSISIFVSGLDARGRGGVGQRW